ncbi:MAG: hypothetical protein ACJZ81_09015 [Paracoccaceae bacterium]|jgi:hypothetical protein|tara:strand:+ start:531 stop:1199 length:669 start_codon:yes stop_codon:yes gene_type:complete
MISPISFGESPSSDTLKLMRYYEELRADWGKIFPNKNRNAGGALFFKYIFDNSDSRDEFFEKNKMYCSVSGSLVQPGSQPEFVSVRGQDEELVCGSLYRCCWPCSCDVMKFVQVQALEKTFDDKPELINVLTIKNPCEKPDFPEEVDRESICVGASLNKKRVTEINGRLVVGVLFESKICSPKDIEKINREVITGSYCPLRNNTPLKEVRGGMGDIFIKMAN